MFETGLENEIARAAEKMSRYRMPPDEQLEVVRILLDAGVEKCLDEQQRLRDEKEAILERVRHRGPTFH